MYHMFIFALYTYYMCIYIYVYIHIYLYIHIYIYICYPPPPGTQVWAWFRCALTAEAGRKNSSDLQVCLIEQRRLGRDPYPFSMALPHEIQFTYLPTQTMPSFKGFSTDHSHIFPHKPCLVSKTLPQKIHTSSHPTNVFLHVFFQ